MPDAPSGSPARDVPPPQAAAFFDVDGTIVSTHIVHQYVHVRKVLARRHGGFLARILYPVWLAGFYAKCLQYLYLDRVSRTRMNIAFYRNYGGLSCDHIRAAAQDCFEQVLKPHVFTPAESCIHEHLRSGRRVILVTGSIDLMIDPLARYFAGADRDGRVDLVARALVERGGRFTGALDGLPIGEREKANAVKRYAQRHGIELSASYAYGDSIADLPMLEIVGFPNVVNADRELARHALARDWPAHVWRLSRDDA